MPISDDRVPEAPGLVPPGPIDVREKPTYPPTRWWPLRVVNPSHKVWLVIGQWLLTRGLGYLLGLGLPSSVVELVSGLLVVATVIVLARSFRGVAEPVEPPRAWWRLTARPRAGWWLAAYFGLPIVALLPLLLDPHRGLSPIGTDELLLNCVLVAAFLNSSIRLTAQRPAERG